MLQRRRGGQQQVVVVVVVAPGRRRRRRRQQVRRGPEEPEKAQAQNVRLGPGPGRGGVHDGQRGLRAGRPAQVQRHGGRRHGRRQRVRFGAVRPRFPAVRARRRSRGFPSHAVVAAPQLLRVTMRRRRRNKSPGTLPPSRTCNWTITIHTCRQVAAAAQRDGLNRIRRHCSSSAGQQPES